MKLWDVRFSNYEPSEVDSTHDNEEAARKRAAELGGGWTVVMHEVGPPSLTEVLKEVAEHGETPAGKGHGIGCVCMDEAARKIRRAIFAAITPARREDKTPEEIEAGYADGDPNPTTWRYLPGEWEREMDQRHRISNVLRMAANRL